jgi:hypothetical protein
MSDDSPTEQIDDDILDRAREARERWINWAAATAAVLAALAAISGAMSTGYLTASGRAQIQSNDDWGYYQAKSIKSTVLRAKLDLLEAMGKSASDADRSKLDQYDRDLNELKERAEQREAASETDLTRHEHLERGVTLFHIGIAIVAIAVLLRKRSFWYLSVLAAVGGIAFLIFGLLH